MPLTEHDRQKIVEQTTAWTDEAFAGIDLSGFPSLQPLPPEDSHDQRFAREYGDTALRRSAADLRNFVSDPDVEALEETGNPTFMADVRDERAERVVLEFKRTRPDYLPTDDNYHAMVTTLAYNSSLTAAEQARDDDEVTDLLVRRGYFTVDNLQRVYDALMAEGLLDVPAGEPRNLNERERLRVARLAQSGRLDESIGEFLRCSLDGDEPTMELLNDPRYKGLCNDAVYFAFSESQLDFVETGSRKAYLLRYCGDRPLTIPLLQQAWKSCQANERRHDGEQAVTRLQQREDRVSDIEALSDDAVTKLYNDSMRAYAESVRRGPGVIV